MSAKGKDGHPVQVQGGAQLMRTLILLLSYVIHHTQQSFDEQRTTIAFLSVQVIFHVLSNIRIGFLSQHAMAYGNCQHLCNIFVKQR